jgi:hypothetical protein
MPSSDKCNSHRVAEYWIRLRIASQNAAYMFGEYRPVSGYLLRSPVAYGSIPTHIEPRQGATPAK